MPTKPELEAENAALRDRVAELETGRAAAPRPLERLKNEDGEIVLSSGELDDLVNRGVTRSPFTGETLNALDEGIEPGNPEARRNAEKAQRDRAAAAGEVVATDPADVEV